MEGGGVNTAIINLLEAMPIKLLLLADELRSDTSYSSLCELFGPVGFIRQAGFPLTHSHVNTHGRNAFLR